MCIFTKVSLKLSMDGADKGPVYAGIDKLPIESFLNVNFICVVYVIILLLLRSNTPTNVYMCPGPVGECSFMEECCDEGDDEGGRRRG